MTEEITLLQRMTMTEYDLYMILPGVVRECLRTEVRANSRKFDRLI